MIRPDGSEIRFEYDSLTRLKSGECERGGLSLRTDKAGQIIREVDFTGVRFVIAMTD
nr:hypothetical protein [Proteus mirabilis]